MSKLDKKYYAQFAFEFINSSELPADKRGGYKVISFNSEREPKTNEEFTEIARQIGKSGEYSKVRVLKVWSEEEDGATRQMFAPSEPKRTNLVGEVIDDNQ